MCNGLVLIASQSCYHLAVFLQEICHMKKCQKCSKPATVHITEIEKHTPNEIHLCETHAQQYLSPGEEQPAQNTAVSILAQYLSTGTVELEQREIKSCPMCEMTFSDFRDQQRLGCPHDYEVFQEELHPLLETIHSETTHCGKVPKRAPGASQRRVQIIKLRNDLKRAIAEEHFEDAANLRDQIHNLEQPLPE